MSANFNHWLGTSEAITPAARAVAARSRIMDKPTEITIKRLGTAQTVRVEYGEGASAADSPAGQGTVRTLTVFGWRDHPTLADTNIRANDRFVLAGAEYIVSDVVLTIGEKQANCLRVA